MPIYQNALAQRPANMLAYQDTLSATPRNQVLGYLADLAAASYAPQRTQQMQGMAQFLSLPAVSQTLDRLSYGEPLTTGRGMTTQIRPEAIEAAMAVAPLAQPVTMATLQAARAARQAAMAGGRAGEKLAERAIPQIMERGGMPAQLAMDLTQGSRRNIFVGEKSKTWNAANAAKAVEMEKAGVSPQDIWMATQTFRGPEGKLRQEVSDTGAKLTLGQGKPDAYGAIEAKTFEGALDHPRLQQAYPELNDINFQHWPKEEYLGANFDPTDNVITMGQKAMEPERGVALHELQHAIQRKEGFAKGGSPSNVLDDWYAGINQELGSLSKQMDALPEFERRFDKSKQEQYSMLRKNYDDLMNKKLYDPPDQEEMYRRLAGEAEARAVQKRMNMTDTQRRVIFPYESYDVPINQLIVRTK